MAREKKNPYSDKMNDDLNQSEMKGEEFSKKMRHKNEVASTEYTGGGKKRGGIEIDRLETGE